MKSLNIKKITGYAVAAVFVGLGVGILAGWLDFRAGNNGMKILFGIFLILYGAYKGSRASMKTLPSERNRFFIPIVLIATALGSAGCHRRPKEPEQTVTTGRMTIIVSEPYKHLFELEAVAFMRYYEKAKINVVGASTREAMVALLNDSVTVVSTDRGMNEEELGVAQKAGMKFETHPVAEDALAVLVNSINGLESISMKTLRNILSGTLKRWERLPASGLTGPIALAMTGRNSGTYELLKNTFFGLEQDIPLSILTTTQDSVLQAAAQRSNAIGLVSVACLRDTNLQSSAIRFAGKVKSLAFTGIDSTTFEPIEISLHQANIYLKKYPLHYTLTMIRNLDRSPLATGFVTFVCSTPGQKIILNSGLVPKQVQIRLVQLNEEALTP
ncbi:MAG TPA: substrate-binding domain-containing protein [bacterium]